MRWWETTLLQFICAVIAFYSLLSVGRGLGLTDAAGPGPWQPDPPACPECD